MSPQPHAKQDGDAPVLASVLIPVLNEERHIRETVAAMQAQRVDGPVEFLFMDGRSEDSTRAILEAISREDPRVRVLDNPERRTAHGLNVGLEAARGEYVVRMDAHGIYPPDYIAAGVERLRRGDTDWVAGPAVPRGTGRWSRRVALALGTGLGAGSSRKWSPDSNGAAEERELDAGVWAGVWRRETLERLGGWDVDWPINQDSELAGRLLGDGGRIVLVPRMAAEYFPRDDLRALAKQYLRYGYYRCKTGARHPSTLRRSLLLPPGVALTLTLAVASPRPVRRLARLGLAAYAATLGASAARVSSRAADPAERADAATLPLVWAVMHLAWGYGFLWYSLRNGPPLAAMARMARPPAE
jgi:cellulose synthase/poly-beta-1,6-N-acetylglucosamine synthase-like glycosyltransferase